MGSKIMLSFSWVSSRLKVICLDVHQLTQRTTSHVWIPQPKNKLRSCSMTQPTDSGSCERSEAPGGRAKAVQIHTDRFTATWPLLVMSMFALSYTDVKWLLADV